MPERRTKYFEIPF